MSGWRERAVAIRAVQERRKATGGTPSAPAREGDGARARQAAFARRIIEEVLAPVLREFTRIVTGEPGTAVFHEYHKRRFGLTCDLDARRFAADVFLTEDGTVRLAVSLIPSISPGWDRDYPLNARNCEIEEWFGTALARLYEAG